MSTDTLQPIDHATRAFAALSDALAGDPPLPAFDLVRPGVVVASARLGGRLLARSVVAGPDALSAAATAFERLDLARNGADTVELNLCHSLHPVGRGLAAPSLENMHAGLVGVALLRRGTILALAAPTELIASNRSPRRAAEHMLGELGLDPAAIDTGEVAIATFSAEQSLLDLATGELRPLYRGARPLDLSAFGEPGVRSLADGMTQWMLNQVGPGGRIVYKYWPSRGRESDGDNTIRQAMATICLGRIAQRSADPAARAAADRNLEHLVATYYRDAQPHGIVIEGDKVKLGGIALTALAILESPLRDRFAPVLARLVETIAWLHDDDGGFRTFYAPEGRNDCQNFYPGETLLFWAHALRAGLPGVSAEAYMRAFRFYREHFRRDPNPAFVPWHSQAHVVVRDVIADPELDAFVFEMNDWLLSMQQWDRAPYGDLRGRFYDAERPWYGAPHASATGVYIEGLVDAFHLARLQGDRVREELYRLALLRGARNLARLQFRTADDMFYVRRRERVEGGIRTEVYNNEIRVDNVQHGLMGLHRVLDRFTARDYAQPDA